MADLADGLIDPRTGNAMCNAGGKMLKVIEMQYRYGSPQEGKVGRILQLTNEFVEAPAIQ